MALSGTGEDRGASGMDGVADAVTDADAEVQRATRTRIPLRSTSISVTPVSSRSCASERTIASCVSVVCFNGSAFLLCGSSSVLFCTLPGVLFGVLGPRDTSSALFRSRDRREPGDGQRVALDAKAADHSFRGFGNVGMVAKAFARVNVGDVHFDDGNLHGEDGIEDGNRRGGIAGRIEDNACGFLRVRLLDPIDDLTLMVRLPELDREIVALAGFATQFLDIS